MRLFEAVITRVVPIVNFLKVMLPFGKVVIISDPNNWIQVNYFAIIRKFIFSRLIVDRIIFAPRLTHGALVVDEDFRNAEYKGINLYHVSKYNICVALELFPSRISCEKEDHKTIISEWYAISSECIDFFEKIIAQKKPDKILISQGHNFDAAVIRALSCKHNFSVVAVENTFNKNKIIWDDLSGIAVNKNLAKNHYWKYRDFVTASVAKSYVCDYLENIKQLKTAEHQTTLETISKSGKKTVLFIGQVYTDASTLFGINDFTCPIEIIEQLVNYCLDNDYHLIIKLHPKEVVGNDILNRPYNNLTYRKIADRDGLLGKITSAGFVLDKEEYDTYSLIDIADVCVTVNSQAGLEALVKGKNLLVCGQSYYSGLGFTFEALNSESLLCALDLVLKHNISFLEQDEINKFFYIISEKYFMDCTEQSVEKLLSKGL